MTSDILDTLADLDDEDFEPDLDEVPGAELEFDGDDGTMSKARAVEITEAIRSAAQVTYLLLAQAHVHNAHKALGYDTWAEYVKEEFDMSAQRSYQLLDLSKVTNEIESVVPDGTSIKLTEAQARDIKRELPLVTERIREALEDGEDATDAVDRVIQEVRDQKKSDDQAAASKQKSLEEAEEEARRAGLESAADQLLENSRPEGSGDYDGDPLEVEVEGDDSNLSPEDSMNLYNFFNVIAGITSLPEPDDFLSVLPASRADEVEEQLLEAVTWLNRFQTLLETRKDS